MAAWLLFPLIAAAGVVLLSILAVRRGPLGLLLRLPFALPFWVIGSLGDLFAVPVHLASGLLRVGWAMFMTLIGNDPRQAWGEAGREFLGVRDATRRSAARLASLLGCPEVAARWRPRPVPPPLPRVPPRRRDPRVYPFEDRYLIEGRLGGGGSTARLFVVRRVHHDRPVGERLVLKYFDLGLGSHLDELVRESRGMQVAKEMGIVLDHRLERDWFYYAMPFYEGETLTRAAARLHRRTPEGEVLPPEDVSTVLAWIGDLLRILDGYHRHGVIHKDVKPDNVIVTADGLRLVDLGLLTPLVSALTLTTHGTEYFRDPEMVKLAVKGRRVKDVDAVRFDVYSAGAVFFYLLEGSFPTCGPLSRFSRPVPMALSWIVSRAMAEGAKRYPTIAAMRADLEAALRLAAGEGGIGKVPASRLPSFGGFDPAERPEPPPVPVEPLPPVLDHLPAVAPARHSRRRVRALLLFLVVALMAASVWTFAVERSSRDRGGPVRATTSLPDLIAGAVEEWREAVAGTLRTAGEDPARFRDVPVLVVVDRSAEFDRLDLARGVRRSLMDRGVSADTSAFREESVRGVLGPDVSAAEVRGALSVEAGGAECPFVLWIAGPGVASRRVFLRGYYGDLAFAREFPFETAP
jgi:hypothetical protein